MNANEGGVQPDKRTVSSTLFTAFGNDSSYPVSFVELEGGKVKGIAVQDAEAKWVGYWEFDEPEIRSYREIGTYDSETTDADRKAQGAFVLRHFRYFESAYEETDESLPGGW